MRAGARRRPKNGTALPLTEFSQKPHGRIASLAAVKTVRVILVIRSKLERLGWSIVLETQTDVELLGQFGSVSEALAFLSAHPADVILIDEAALTPKHCEALRSQAVHGGPRFLLVTRHPVDETLEHSRYSFASDCLLKGVSAAELLAAIRQNHEASR